MKTMTFSSFKSCNIIKTLLKKCKLNNNSLHLTNSQVLDVNPGLILCMKNYNKQDIVNQARLSKQKCALGNNVVKGRDRKPVAECDPDRRLPSKPDHTDHRPLKHTGSYTGPNYLSFSSSATASGDRLFEI